MADFVYQHGYAIIAITWTDEDQTFLLKSWFGEYIVDTGEQHCEKAN